MHTHTPQNVTVVIRVNSTTHDQKEKKNSEKERRGLGWGEDRQRPAIPKPLFQSLAQSASQLHLKTKKKKSGKVGDGGPLFTGPTLCEASRASSRTPAIQGKGGEEGEGAKRKEGSRKTALEKKKKKKDGTRRRLFPVHSLTAAAAGFPERPRPVGDEKTARRKNTGWVHDPRCVV